MVATIIYTDGACLGNPGRGGWGWYVPATGQNDSGGEPETTNNRMEMMAVIEAINSIEGELQIYSDSKYIVDCFHKEWWKGWQRRDWKTTAKQPVKNRDLWEPLLKVVKKREIEFIWVKGHSGDLANEEVDRLAVDAAYQQPVR